MYAPHIFLLCAAPGDEVLGASAAIMRAREQGCRVTAMMLTNGLPNPPAGFIGRLLARGRTRTIDTIITASRHVAGAMGYDYISWDRAHGAGSVPPRMLAITQTIHAAIARLQPQALWVPAFIGLSPDHDALNIIASRVKQIVPQLNIFEYATPPIHLADRRYGVMFPAKQGMELALNLSQTEAGKRQRHAELLLRAGARFSMANTERELFRPLAAADYTKPPYGYLTMNIQQPSRAAKAAGARIARRVLPLFAAYLRTPPTVPAPPLPIQESR